MFNVLENKMLVPNIHQLTVEAPEVVKEIKPGQFVILRAEEDGERIPLSISDLRHKYHCHAQGDAPQFLLGICHIWQDNGMACFPRLCVYSLHNLNCACVFFGKAEWVNC